MKKITRLRKIAKRYGGFYVNYNHVRHLLTVKGYARKYRKVQRLNNNTIWDD